MKVKLIKVNPLWNKSIRALQNKIFDIVNIEVWMIHHGKEIFFITVDASVYGLGKLVFKSWDCEIIRQQEFDFMY